MKRESILITALLLLFSTVTVAKTVEETAADLYQRGLAALRKGSYEKSVKHLTEAIELVPTEYRYYNDRGVIYKRMEKLELAAADYTRALQIKPDYTNALNNRGVVYLQQSDYGRAIRDFDRALLHGGLEAKILTNRGLAHLRQGDNAKAVEDLKKAISYRPLDHRAFLYLGEALEKSGRNEKALKLYQLAVRVAKDRRISKTLEQRIHALRKALAAADRPSPKPLVKRSARLPESTSQPTGALKQSETLPGPPKPNRTTVVPDEPEVSDPALATITLSALDKRSREKAVQGFSHVTREIYLQGVKFKEDSEQRKAVVRFQDALQLARRKKNRHGVAWCLLEIGRVHSATGEYFEALPYLKNAVKRFLKMKLQDEAILSLVALARTSRSAGLKHEEKVFVNRAGEIAKSQGYTAISAEIATSRRPRSRVSHQMNSTKPPAAKMTKAKGSTPPGRESTPPHLARVGRGPYLWGRRSGKSPDREPKSPLPKPTAVPPELKAVAASAQQPGRVSFNIGNDEAQTKPTTVGDQMLQLKKLRKDSDETGMIAVLERLHELYELRNDWEKALHCLDAAIGFREKLGRTDEMSKRLYKRGLLREKLGKRTLALEDYTRAVAFATTEGNVAQADTARAKAKSVAKKLRLNPKNTLMAFQRLWDARNKRRKHAETRALHTIAGVFRYSDKYRPAIDYYDRTSASLLLEKVDVLTKMGKDDEAEKAREQSLRTLKRLDYSRYIEALRKEDKSAVARRR